MDTRSGSVMEAGSIPVYPTFYRVVVQWIEYGIWDAEVAGLSPVYPTDFQLVIYI